MDGNAELASLLTGLESDRVERKERFQGMERKVHETVCALANDLPGSRKPGYVAIGLDDNGRPVGLPVSDDLLKRLSEIRTDGTILPPPVLSVEPLEIGGQTVAVITVQPSDSPPVRYRGRVHVRVGPTTRMATAEEERRLSEKRRDLNRPFDQQPFREGTLGDLDLAFYRSTYLPSVISPDVLQENGRSIEDYLVTSRFLSPIGHAPTVAGILIAGLDPMRWLPGAYVQFVRFSGEEMTDPIQDDKLLDGTLFQQARQLDDLLKLNVQRASRSGEDFRRQETVDYPLPALREMVLNALVHRNYDGTNAPVRIYWFSNRVEIHSPGGLYGLVTAENFTRATDYRNPTIAEAMKVLGYIERFGVGIQRIYRSLRENGNPEPEFDFSSATHVLVTVRRRPE